MALLEKAAPIFKVVHVYLQEAHADDHWPLGFGINSSKNIDERWANCDTQLAKPEYERFKNYLDLVVCDTMDNQFIEATGCWPEAYYVLDKDGKCLFDSRIQNLKPFERMEKWLNEQGYL